MNPRCARQRAAPTKIAVTLPLIHHGEILIDENPQTLIAGTLETTLDGNPHEGTRGKQVYPGNQINLNLRLAGHINRHPPIVLVNHLLLVIAHPRLEMIEPVISAAVPII